MAKHNELGKAGENAAVTYLEQQGYIIRDRNWRKLNLPNRRTLLTSLK